jgi:hypothetical protein
MGRHAKAAVRGCRLPGSGLTGMSRVRGTRSQAFGRRRNSHGARCPPGFPASFGNDDPSAGGDHPLSDGEAHRAAGKSCQAEANLGGRIGSPREGSKGRNDRGSSPILKFSLAVISSIAARVPAFGGTSRPYKGPGHARPRPLSLRRIGGKARFLARHFILPLGQIFG